MQIQHHNVSGNKPLLTFLVCSVMVTRIPTDNVNVNVFPYNTVFCLMLEYALISCLYVFLWVYEMFRN